ncbi:mechanosensitive ion channel family protein [Haloferacaceae archaeon DSL9]
MATTSKDQVSRRKRAAAAPLAGAGLPLQQNVPEFLQETVSIILTFIPRLIGALLILLIGYVIGRVIGRIVTAIVDRVELDKLTLRTPIGDALGGSERAVSNAFGKLAAYYIYLLAVLAAANALGITILSQLVNEAALYLPAFIAGLLIIVVGFIVADFIARVVRESVTETETGYRNVFSDGVRVFLYFMVLVIGLETMGFGVEILYIFAQAVAYGLGAAIAIGLGLAIGLGGREYVSDNVNRWMRRASPESSESEPGMRTGSDTGTTGGDGMSN